MTSMFKTLFKNIVNKVKNNFNWKKIVKTAMYVCSTVAMMFAIYFGLKYFKLKDKLKCCMVLLKDTQGALQSVSAKATQLTLDNTVLSEMLGMILHIPGEIYV